MLDIEIIADEREGLQALMNSEEYNSVLLPVCDDCDCLVCECDWATCIDCHTHKTQEPDDVCQHCLNRDKQAGI